MSRLEKLANKYGVKLKFVPKYHCELNPIEGYWCHAKAFIRKYTDQSFNTLLQLFPQAKKNFVDRNISLKLFRRFWKAMSAYDQGKSYADVLKLFYSNSCSATIVSHTRITNTNLYST